MPAGAENAAGVDKRGWCLFERRLSSIIKTGRCCLTLSRMGERDGDSWRHLVMACMAGRLAPLAPDAFEALLRDGMAREEAEAGTGFRFTNGKDATEVCIPQYREAFLRLMRGAEVLSFMYCSWGDDEVEQLCGALAYAHAAGSTTAAEGLYLTGNALTDAALAHLARAFAAGLVPRLEWLRLGRNKLTGAGLDALRPALADGHLAGLKELELSGSKQLGDGGAKVLAAALSEGKLPRLEELHLGGTGMGDEGARALAGALGGAPALRELKVGENEIGAAAKKELWAVCAERGVELK